MTPSPKLNVGFPILIGFAALAVLVAGVGVWGTQARIAGAVISSGMIQVESNRQVLQHPDGGVVGEILVRDGDWVDAGDIVLSLDDTALSSAHSIAENELYEINARVARLTAERDGLDQVHFQGTLLKIAQTDGEVAEILAGQTRLFDARQTALHQQVEQINEQIAQTENQIRGEQSQLDAYAEQQQLASEELARNVSLYEKNLVQLRVVTSLQQENAQLRGEIGKLTANMARLNGQIAGYKIEILRLKSARREEAITTLRDLQYRALELTEQKRSLLDALGKMDIKTPVSGVIYGSRVFAIQSVVSPAEPIMYVIPQDQPLIVSARVEAIHIDQVHLGQEVSLRFTAFDQRTTPEIEGVVSKLSADVFQDEHSGQSFYQAEFIPKSDELLKLKNQELLPGMPVEAFIKTGERTPLSYLAKPLSDYFQRAFRET